MKNFAKGFRERGCLWLVGLLVVAVVLMQRACTRVYRFPAPDGAAEVRMQTKWGLADAKLDVWLDEGWWLRNVRFVDRDDCAPLFVHAAWSADSSRVAVYVRDGLCGVVWAAYDRRERRFVAFDEVADVMRQSVRRAYGLDAGVDPLVWMQGPGMTSLDDPARQAFREKWWKVK